MVKELVKNSNLSIPDDFAFPFDPYSIQTAFMRSLYATLERGGVGIFESPTGTGKSMSVICGALRWLKDDKRRYEDQLAGNGNSIPLEATDGDGDPEWVTEFVMNRKQQEITQCKAEELTLRRHEEQRLHHLKKELHTQRLREAAGLRMVTELGCTNDKKPKHKRASVKRKKGITIDGTSTGDTYESDPFKEKELLHILDEYISDDEAETRLYQSYRDSSDDGDNDCYPTVAETRNPPRIRKIFYCSRTHSQLTQFIGELRRSPYADDVAVVALGSRRNLCVNPFVRSLPSVQQVNDRCSELRKSKTRKTDDHRVSKKRKDSNDGGCAFLNWSHIENFKDHVLVDVKDVEDLARHGQQTDTCAYYGSRAAISGAEVVVLPYNMLLHRATRESVGIDLKDNIVVIDEAHNIIDTVSALHSVKVSGVLIIRAHSQLTTYVKRYQMKLKAKNLIYLKQLMLVLVAFLTYLRSWATDVLSSRTAGQCIPVENLSRILKVNDFVFALGIDNINLFKLRCYCEKTQLARKLLGFMEWSAMTNSKNDSVEVSEESSNSRATSFLEEECSEDLPEQYQRSISALKYVEDLLYALTNTDKDGRVTVTLAEPPLLTSSREGNVNSLATMVRASTIKFLLLNPAVYFSNILAETHAVVLAGGTMQPTSDFMSQLMEGPVTVLHPEAPPQQTTPFSSVSLFSCGHVIPPENLLSLSLGVGPTNVPLDFRFQSRSNTALMEEVGRLIVNVAAVVPGGIVVFFPSYDYEAQVHAHWLSSGIISRLQLRKVIYREPRSSETGKNIPNDSSYITGETVLSRYAACIRRCSKSLLRSRTAPTGALLTCVVGGKMSEGINFSDELGRCIVMVGMPFPNSRSPELLEKMSYLDKKEKALLDNPTTTTTTTNYKEGLSAGSLYYENLCMKAVNQSIGRAIRHRNDYSSILLLDQRYQKPSVIEKLPIWIAQQTLNCPTYGRAHGTLASFFAKKAINEVK